jgi:hypothetical protein
MEKGDKRALTAIDGHVARRAIREMLAYGLNDPYTRFITPQEFQAMRKYDVTGVGLNLATADEFTHKSGLPLPPDRSNAQVQESCMGPRMVACRPCPVTAASAPHSMRECFLTNSGHSVLHAHGALSSRGVLPKGAGCSRPQVRSIFQALQEFCLAA